MSIKLRLREDVKLRASFYIVKYDGNLCRVGILCVFSALLELVCCLANTRDREFEIGRVCHLY